MSFESVMPPYNASDPTATFVNSSCLDFLLIELVPLAFRVANELEARAADALPTPPPAPAVQVVPPPGEPPVAGARPAANGAGPHGLDDEEERKAVFHRLDTLGYRVGQGLVERFVPVLSAGGSPAALAAGFANASFGWTASRETGRGSTTRSMS